MPKARPQAPAIPPPGPQWPLRRPRRTSFSAPSGQRPRRLLPGHVHPHIPPTEQGSCPSPWQRRELEKVSAWFPSAPSFAARLASSSRPGRRRMGREARAPAKEGTRTRSSRPRPLQGHPKAAESMLARGRAPAATPRPSAAALPRTRTKRVSREAGRLPRTRQGRRGTPRPSDPPHGQLSP